MQKPILVLALCVAPGSSLRVGRVASTRRQAVGLGLLSPALLISAQLPAAAEDSPSLQRLRRLGDGARKGELAPGVDLVDELLQRTEANRAKNEAAVARVTQQNAFTAIDGSVSKRLVTDTDGTNLYLNERQIQQLVREGRLACAPSVMEPCRILADRPGGREVRDVPSVRPLACEQDGSNCKFGDE